MKAKSRVLAPEDLAPHDFLQIIHSPIGTLAIIATEVGIRSVTLIGQFTSEQNPNIHTNAAAVQLEKYFNGQLQKFELVTDLAGYTEFSLQVWKELMKIPFGQTISYAQLALRLGNPLCIRAAATANGRNPIPIIIPCHRVVGSDGSLTGFALGLDVKRQLLCLENPAKYNIIQTTLFS